MSDSASDSSRFLRNALRANALFSGVSGLCGLVAAAPLAELLGVAPPFLVSLTGLNLIAFAVLLVVVASRRRVASAWVKAIIAADVMWVVGSAALIPTGVFSALGRWVVASLAGIVGLLAILQYTGVRRMSRSALDARSGKRRPARRGSAAPLGPVGHL